MSEISKYDLCMKILEIVERDQKSSLTPPTAIEERAKVITIIEKIEGNLLLKQDAHEEVSVKIKGDTFEKITSSMIATRQSIVSGIIKVRETEGDEVADALQQLEQAIAQVDPKTMSDEDKQKALKLLEELTNQASSPNRVKVVLEALGKSLWDGIKNVDPLVKVATLAWPIIQKLWG